VSKNTKKIEDPLKDLTANIFDLLKHYHGSPSQSHEPDGFWFYKRFYCSQEERNLFEGNASMAAGIAVNDAVQWYYCTEIYKWNVNLKKFTAVKLPKITKEAAAAKAIEKFKEYKPVSELDQAKYEHYLSTSLPETIQQAFLALDELGLTRALNPVAEFPLSQTDKRLQKPTEGRVDISFKNVYKAKERSKAVISPQRVKMILSVLEIKTSWQKPSKVRKDGTRGFASIKIPSFAKINHIRQTAFYTESMKPSKPYLINIWNNGYKIWNEDNCEDLQPKKLKYWNEQLIKDLMRHERLLMRYAHLTDLEEIKQNILKDLEPNFDHPFYWNIGSKNLQLAKEAWSNR
jgi:hypothetical protein